MLMGEAVCVSTHQMNRRRRRVQTRRVSECRRFIAKGESSGVSREERESAQKAAGNACACKHAMQACTPCINDRTHTFKQPNTSTHAHAHTACETD